MLYIREDLKADRADKFFDNICDENGTKLSKQAKRTRLMQLMRDLYYNHPEQNHCVLPNGETVPLIIAKCHPTRGEFCCFNTSSVPAEIVLLSFAEKVNITGRITRPKPKQAGELIVSDIKNLMDNVTVDGKKVTDARKRERLNELFEELYNTPAANICPTSDGREIPIIIERLGVNNWNVFCLNTSEYRAEVLSAFADYAGCTYCREKENAVTPPERLKTEMTARECARIFHGVPNLDGSMAKRDLSPKLVEWFAHIYESSELNFVNLPDGTEAPLLLSRISFAKKCICLNTADESVKPFVIKRMAEITGADICWDNLKIREESLLSLHKATELLSKAEEASANCQDKEFYQTYRSRVSRVIVFGSRAFETKSPKDSDGR